MKKAFLFIFTCLALQIQLSAIGNSKIEIDTSDGSYKKLANHIQKLAKDPHSAFLGIIENRIYLDLICFDYDDDREPSRLC